MSIGFCLLAFSLVVGMFTSFIHQTPERNENAGRLKSRDQRKQSIFDFLAIRVTFVNSLCSWYCYREFDVREKYRLS